MFRINEVFNQKILQGLLQGLKPSIETRVNTFGNIKVLSKTIFDMIVITYHDKTLIFDRMTL